MRALEPTDQGRAVRDGIALAWEVFGSGEHTVFLLPTWSIIHSRQWKLQVPALARRHRVLVMDGRGNGRSGRPLAPEAYADEEYAADAVAVMDASGTESAHLVSVSAGARWALLLAANHAERVRSAAFLAPGVPIAPGNAGRVAAMLAFEEPRDSYVDWFKYNANFWLLDHRGFLEFFFSKVFSEPHSMKPIEDAVAWGLETTPEVLVATARAPVLDESEARRLISRVNCPVLVIHGDEDEAMPHARGAALAAATGGQLLTLEGSGHGSHARDPIAVNHALLDFLPAPKGWRSRRRALRRSRRALVVSSPIGLGHARRDIAIARELRALIPGLEIDWLAQHPVTAVLAEHGERVHPASQHLASESRHIELEAGEHRLAVFEAFRRMDEILVANFEVFHDVVRSEDYDVWIGDEAWEVDHFLFENPELKTAPYVWMTDFVGWLPMPGRGDREAVLTADMNAEMVEHVARFPRLRDRAIFIGCSEDVVDESFGPDLPRIRPWVEAHYRFTDGYPLELEPGLDAGRLRRELGYRDEDVVAVAAVGGSGVGGALLARILESFPAARDRIPNLRLVAVAGPRLDPAALPRVDGVEVLGFLPDLDRHLASCDVGLVQGGLTTTMELAAYQRPFLFFPLRDHFEQQFHVRHRLARYGAGLPVDFDEATPEVVAGCMVAALRSPRSAPVERGAAGRAAAIIAELLT